jgi:GNAT superfamily N-acetyltransferase
MSSFSQTTTDFWNQTLSNGKSLHCDQTFLLTVNPALNEERRVMVLETAEGRVMAAVTPRLADKLSLVRRPVRSPDAFRQRLDEVEVTLHGADCVFYFSEADKQSLRDDQADGSRRLTDHDQAAFAEFQSTASEQDLEDAYVELDHWVVFGAFEQNRLVSAASAYPWAGEQIADLGVLTLERFRGRGHARKLVRSIGRYALRQGYEPQYRSQIDNDASVALARAAGLTLFGWWEVVSPNSTDQVFSSQPNGTAD